MTQSKQKKESVLFSDERKRFPFKILAIHHTIRIPVLPDIATYPLVEPPTISSNSLVIAA